MLLSHCDSFVSFWEKMRERWEGKWCRKAPGISGERRQHFLIRQPRPRIVYILRPSQVILDFGDCRSSIRFESRNISVQWFNILYIQFYLVRVNTASLLIRHLLVVHHTLSLAKKTAKSRSCCLRGIRDLKKLG